MRSRLRAIVAFVAGALLVAGAQLAGAAQAPAGEALAHLAGVWDAAVVLGDDLAGPVVVTAARASLGGYDAASEDRGHARLYTFPGGRGVLYVALPAGDDPTAFWIQPPNVNGSTYATPVDLHAATPGQWHGDVEPLPNRVHMSLYFGRNNGGSGAGANKGNATVFLRDPLYNIGRRFETMTVSAHGANLRFAREGYVLDATLDDADTLTLHFPKESGLPSLRFARRTASVSSVPRTYSEPQPAGDGWTIGTPADAGFRTPALDELVAFAAGSAPTSVESPDVHAVLVARHGKLVVDQYFGGFDAATLHDTRSAAKTYADVLAGAAQQAGVVLDGDTPLLPLFARYGTLANPDPRKAQITLGDALSMATGLDCDDDDEHSVANEDNEQRQSAQPDWYRLVLDTRMVRDPGTKAVYCSASINLAGGAIASAAHAWLPAYFARHVAAPLQMQRYALDLTPAGDWYLGGGAYVRPRDFLKIGQLFLDGGTWNGTQVVPRAWIARSWDAHLSLGAGDDYGYAWHVRSYSVAGTAYRAYEAEGNGGQILDVIPQLDLVVMLTQGNYNNFGTWGPMRDAIVTRVISAIEH